MHSVFTNCRQTHQCNDIITHITMISGQPATAMLSLISSISRVRSVGRGRVAQHESGRNRRAKQQQQQQQQQRRKARVNDERNMAMATTPKKFELAVCSPSDADDAALVAHLVAMVNAAYTRGEGLASEGGMWKGERVERTNAAEACALLRARKLVLCRPADAAGADAAVPAPCLAGSVLCDVAFDAAARVGELGMLCVDATCLGQGVGRLLMREAEATCVAAGCVAMRLELLSPSEFAHPVKVWLDGWYQREGYVKGALEDFASAYPRIAPLLVPCVFTTYRKELA